MSELSRTPVIRRAEVFDARLWGGRDVGDNSQFWKWATVLDVEGHGKRKTATVRFDHDGRVSRGHFVDGLRNAS
jgi:hypothetical protein